MLGKYFAIYVAFLYRVIIRFFFFFVNKPFKFFFKLYFPFKAIFELRKNIKKNVIKTSASQYQIVSKTLCDIFGLNYELVIRDKKDVVKYINHFTYFWHRISFFKNNYFLY
jgi:hypothetical protein